MYTPSVCVGAWAIYMEVYAGCGHPYLGNGLGPMGSNKRHSGHRASIIGMHWAHHSGMWVYGLNSGDLVLGMYNGYERGLVGASGKV